MMNPITSQADDCMVPAAEAQRFDAKWCPDHRHGEPIDTYEVARVGRPEEAAHANVSIATHWLTLLVSLLGVELIDMNCYNRVFTFHKPADPAKAERVELSAQPLDARRAVQAVLDQLDERWHIVQSSDGERTIAINMERVSVCILHNPRNPRKISVKCDQWYALDTRLFRAESLPHIYELMRASLRAYTAGVVKEWRGEQRPAEEAPESADRKRRAPSSTDEAECIARETKAVCVARTPSDVREAHPEGGADAGDQTGKPYCPNADAMATEPEKH